MFTIIDEHTRECLAIELGRRLDADAVLHSVDGAVRVPAAARLYPF
jgi:hypothetical protein